MRGFGWRAYLAAGVVAGVVYFALPTVAAKDVLYLAVAAGSAVATLAAALRRGAHNRAPRMLLGIGLTLWVGGEAVWTTYEVLLHRAPPYPSVADAMYLAAYPLFAIALVALIGGLRGTRGVLIEALAVSVGAGAAMWVFVGERYFASAESALSKGVSLATPIADVVLLGALTCAFVLPGRHSAATRWLMAGVVSTLVADLLYSLGALAETYRTGAWLDVGWIAFYVTWGVAALHPSMDDPAVERPVPLPRYGRRRLSVLLVAGLLPPATLALEVALGRIDELPAMSVMCVLTFVLVGARLAHLWRMAADDARALAERRSELEDALSHLERLERQRADLLRATVRAAEEERVRVSADLHDGAVQKLTAMMLRAGALETRFVAAGNEDARAGVAAIRVELGTQIAELRRVIADLRPPELDHGLPTALRELVDRFVGRTDAVVRLRTDGEERVEPDVETILFRVTQEALSNVAKHAGARAVDVRVRVSADGAGVTIRDDGKGFDPPRNGELVRQGHFGLAGMRERVEAAGGRLTVTSAPGAGSEIAAEIPVGANVARIPSGVNVAHA